MFITKLMTKKKILIISRGFHPEISPRSFRTTELAKELARQGHEVTVWLPDKGMDYTDFEHKNNLKVHYMGKLHWKAIPINGRFSMLKRAFRRALLLFFEYPNIEMMFMVNRSLRNLPVDSNYDLLISIAVPYPIHWGAAMARSQKRPLARTWVADCGDPYMGDTNDSFRKLFHFKYVEKWFSRKTDYITIPRIEMISQYYPEFHTKIRAIPQGFQMDGNLLEKYIKNKVPTFAFAGGFIRTTRDPTELLKYLKSYNKDFRFYIFTRDAGLVLPFKQELGNKLIIQDFIPRDKLLKQLSKMDFLINIGYDPATQSPSKLIDYAISGRPILNITSTLNKKIINEFLNGDYTHAHKVENLQQYDIKDVARRFIELTGTQA